MHGKHAAGLCRIGRSVGLAGGVAGRGAERDWQKLASAMPESRGVAGCPRREGGGARSSHLGESPLPGEKEIREEMGMGEVPPRSNHGFFGHDGIWQTVDVVRMELLLKQEMPTTGQRIL